MNMQQIYHFSGFRGILADSTVDYIDYIDHIKMYVKKIVCGAVKTPKKGLKTIHYIDYIHFIRFYKKV